MSLARTRDSIASKQRPLARGDACTACRTRKIRCPAERPACANCTKHKRECVYSDTRYARTTSTSQETGRLQPTLVSRESQNSIGSSLTLSPTPVSTTLQETGLATLSLTPSSFQSQSTPDWSFPFTTFLPAQNQSGSPDWGQTLPPEFAGLDVDQLMRDVAQMQGDTAHIAPNAGEEPTEAELEHLLWLYFSHQKLFSLEMHIGTFWERLRSPDPQQRPHPCLLNAMYLVTCWASPSESIKARREQFYWVAREAFNQAIRDYDRPIDAYGTARFSDGAAMVSVTASLAIACGLHIIPSARYSPAPTTYRRSVQRYTRSKAPPAASQIELADRIYAFWAIFVCDRCAAVSQEWPENFNVDRVSTPLPHWWWEYETPGDHLDNHQTLYDLMMGRPPTSDCTQFTSTIKAIELTLRASHLKALVRNPEANQPAVQFDYPFAVWSGGERTQQERQMIEHALKVFSEHLPPSLQSSLLTAVDEEMGSTRASMHYLIGLTQMFLYDTNLPDGENTQALAVVRRLLGVMHVLTNRNDWGDVGLFVVMIWDYMGRLLVREGLRLERMGDMPALALVDTEIKFLKEVLRGRGRHMRLAELQVEDLDVLWPVGKFDGTAAAA